MIDLTGPAGVFPTAAAVAGALAVLDRHRAVDLPAALAAVYARAAGSPALAPGVLAAAAAYAPGGLPLATALAQLLAADLLAAANADPDRRLPLSTPADAVLALIRDMAAAGQSVRPNAVGVAGAVDPTAPPNVGDGVLVASATGPDGLPLQGIFAEYLGVAVAADSVTGTAPAGAEPLALAGLAAAPAALAPSWPAGSGAALAFNAVAPGVAPAAGAFGSLLANGDFETFAAGVPTGWTVATAGAAQVGPAAAGQAYAGAGALAIAGDGQSLPALLQPLPGPAPGVAPLAATAYAANFWGALLGAPAAASPPGAGSAGVLELALVDAASGIATTDAAGAPNAATFDLALGGWGSAYAPRSAVFRTPAPLPAAGLQLRLRVVAPVPAGATLLLDRLALARLREAYVGGPLVAAFAGATPLRRGDSWLLAATNDRAGAYQTLFDRLFDLRGLRHFLPAAAPPTIADPPAA